ncbi:LacI family transcriptional regulator [Orbus hercynius]|uniref:LacI family transcriptional regulator n=1 Tax=Orbus hercynius TaxID=593135 RepID=A0A495RJX5_9GAMM|nr:LacI family DNA-binding transcriptional regulator [Orbus hercynius]RKS87631.1 LacI family transcriptional regulator [Orbus hercynius]
MASLKDVAKLAGVSLMTVSRALNSPDKLSEETYINVKKAIDQLNYVPDVSALKIRGDRKVPKLIGVLALDTATTPFSVELLQGIEKTAQTYQCNTLVVNLFDDKDAEQAINTILSYRPTGIIFTSMGFRQISIPAKLHDRHLVLANCITSDIKVASYVPDDYQGQYASIEYIIAKGYRRPLCIYLSPTILAGKIRRQAVEQAWQDNGLSLDLIRSYHLNLDLGDEHYLETIAIIQRYFSQDTSEFDIIICGNDRIALLVYQVLLGLGYRIPQQIAVLGYDNMVGIGQLFYPPLTTVELPHYQIGEHAALHIINQLSDTQEHKINCPLLERSSL